MIFAGGVQPTLIRFQRVILGLARSKVPPELWRFTSRRTEDEYSSPVLDLEKISKNYRR